MRFKLLCGLVLFTTIPAFSATTADWSKVEEQTEHAFTVEAPKSWDTNVGVTRRPGASIASLWVNSSAPDHKTSLYIGPPPLPIFVLPGGVMREGQQFPGPAGGSVCKRFETGEQFASNYGRTLLPREATDVKLDSSKNEPEITAKALEYMDTHAGRRPTALTVGSATFSYMLNGEKKSECLIVSTMLTAGPIGGNWSVTNIWGYRTPPGSETTARAILDHVKATLLPDPQWVSAQLSAQSAINQQAMTMLKQQQDQSSAMLKQQADSNQALLNERHAQGMATLQRTADRANAQAASDADWHKNQMVNHYAQMAVKDNNNYHEVLMIQNKHLEYSPELHGSVAVPNY